MYVLCKRTECANLHHCRSIRMTDGTKNIVTVNSRTKFLSHSFCLIFLNSPNDFHVNSLPLSNCPLLAIESSLHLSVLKNKVSDNPLRDAKKNGWPNVINSIENNIKSATVLWKMFLVHGNENELDDTWLAILANAQAETSNTPGYCYCCRRCY